MKILEERCVTLDWADINGRVTHPEPAKEPRSSGYHVSGILRQVALRSNHLNKKYAVQDPDDMPVCIALGFAWEAWAVGLYHNMIWQPGSRCKDDIHGNCDGLTMYNIGGTEVKIIEEFKYTLKSQRSHRISAQWMWIEQVKSYCVLHNARFVRFHIMWAAGTYRPPTPLYRTYLIEFEQKELDENWDLLLKNRHLAIPE